MTTACPATGTPSLQFAAVFQSLPDTAVNVFAANASNDANSVMAIKRTLPAFCLFFMAFLLRIVEGVLRIALLSCLVSVHSDGGF